MPDTHGPTSPVELFYSYAHEDETLRDELEAHLSVLKREKVITSWHDRMIPSGFNWAGEIDEHINSAQIIILLLSSDFIQSRYCVEVEMKRALERHHANEARVIPVVLRPCDWKSTELRNLQAAPKGGKAVTKWEDRDEALLDVTKSIRQAIEQLHQHQKRETRSGLSFDVCFCHNKEDAPAIETLTRRLQRAGIRPWQDQGKPAPSDSSTTSIESILNASACCAVVVGSGGSGSWQTEEVQAAIENRLSNGRDGFRVIPVLLPGANRPDRGLLPGFLSTTTWAEFRHSLNDEEPFLRLTSSIRGENSETPPEAPFEGLCPYRGLQPFEEAQAQFFFGREALTEWLLNALRPPTHGSGPENRFLAILGPSGSGKSSLALAGLVPALRRGELGDLTPWPVIICRPGYDPLDSLAVHLAPTLGSDPTLSTLRDLITSLRDDQRALHLSTRLALRDAPKSRRLVVVVDQFEEAFTLCQDEATRQVFIDNLLYAANIAGGQTVVVLTLRADFVGKCALHPGLAAALSSHQLLVGPMLESELRQAIVRPAQLAGCEVETGLTELLIQDVAHQRGALPLLQYALRELWERRAGRRLTGTAYREIGGLEGALENRANAVLRSFTPDEQTLCRRLFLRLTQPGEGTEDTKRRVGLRELSSPGDRGASLEGVIQRLVDARLITAEGEEKGRASEGGTIEVAHEALIRGWKELRQWIDADRAGLRVQHRLSESAHEWNAAGRHSSYLYAGAKLAVAREWAILHPDELTALENDFLTGSEAAERHREAAEIKAAQQREADAQRLAREAKKKLRATRFALASLVAAGAFAVAAAWSIRQVEDQRSKILTEARQSLDNARKKKEEALSHKDLSYWKAALQAADDAVARAQFVGDEQLKKQVRQEFLEIRKEHDITRKDSDIRHRLEEARIQSAGTMTKDIDRASESKQVVEEYTKIFQDYQIDLNATANPSAVRIVGNSGIRDTLIAALDDCADLTPVFSLDQRLRALARNANPNPNPDEVREAIKKRDGTALKRIARRPDLDRLPPVTLERMGRALRLVGEVQEAVDLLQRAQDLFPNDFWIHVYLAAALSDLKPPKHEESLRHYTAALALRPKSPGIYIKIGQETAELGNLDESLKNLDSAIRLDPLSSWAHNIRGGVRRRKHEYNRAIEDYNEAIRLDPQSRTMYFNRGLARSDTRQYDMAIADFDKSIQLDPDYARAYYSRGHAWVSKHEHGKGLQDFDKAIALFTKDLSQRPNDATVFYYRGNARYSKKVYDEAITDYNEAIRLEPSNASLYYGRGYAWYVKKEYGKAIEDYNQALGLNPNYARAYAARGRAWYYRSEYDKAMADYDNAIRLDPNDPGTYEDRADVWDVKRLYEKEIADLDIAVRLDPQNPWRFNARGYAWKSQLQYDKAIAEYDMALRLDSKIGRIYLNRGNVWRSKRENDKARADFDRAIACSTIAIQANPRLAEAYEIRGNSYYNKKKYTEALADFGEALRLDPKNKSTYHDRAHAWTDKEEYDKAIEDLNQTIRLDGNYAEGYNDRGYVWYLKSNNDKAIEDIKEAIRINPMNAWTHNNYGLALTSKGEFDKAIDEYNQAIRIDADFALAYTNRGDAWRKKKNNDQAFIDYEWAIRIDPKGSRAYERRSLAWEDQKEFDKAIADIDTAIRLDPIDSSKYNARGLLWEAKKDPDRAIRDYDKAIELNPKFSYAYRNRANVFVHRKEYEKAIADFDHAILINPKFTSSKNDRARAISARREQLIERYTEAIRLRPEDGTAYYHRGNAFVEKNDHERALPDFIVAHRLDPNLADISAKLSTAYLKRGQAWYVKKNYEKAIEDFDAGIRASESAALYFGRADAWLASNKLDQAIHDFNEAIRLDPKNSAAFHDRGVAWNQKRETVNADADYTEAIRLNPNYAQAYAHRGDLRLNEKKYDEALADYTKAVDLGLKDAAVYCNRGTVRRALKSVDKALEDYAESIRLDPNLTVVHEYCYGIWLEKRMYANAISECDSIIRMQPRNAAAFLARGEAWRFRLEFDTAIFDYDAAIRLNPSLASAYIGRGFSWNAKREFDKALKDFERAIQLGPGQALALSGRGDAHSLNKETKQAILDYDEAIHLDPKQSYPYKGRGSCWTLLKEYGKAITDFDAAIRLDPKDADAFNRRGQAWRRTKEYDKAIVDFLEAIRLEPRFSTPYNNLAWLWATCPIEKYRDGKKAIEYAKNASTLLNAKSANELDTLAAAQAETAQFDQAIESQIKAIIILKWNDTLATRFQMSQRLLYYILKLPYRE